MKKILCFGDSNTFGFNPENGRRYDTNTRWTKVLENITYKKYKIIEAGCNNRTAFVNNPSGELQTGYKVLPRYLADDLSAVILQIGINDSQYVYKISLEELENGISELIKTINSKCPKTKIILVSPSVITTDILKSYFSSMFDETSIEKSKHYSLIYKRVAEKYNCLFLDLSEIVNVSTRDGLHYEPEDHKKIAYSLATLLNNEFTANLSLHKIES